MANNENRDTGVVVKIKKQKITKQYALYCGDCCEVLPGLPDESVGFSVFSPPFVSLYKYTDEDADMSNSDTPDQFFKHFAFLVKELKRLLIPGRVVAVHCSDLPKFKRDGDEICQWDFPGELIRCFEQYGFVYHSRTCIWKDPLIEAVRTHIIGLAHKQIVKDSAMTRAGIADYVLAFRKPGENPKPIGHPYGLTEYHGSRSMPRELSRWEDWKGDQGKNKRSQWIWQQYASPVWFDIRQTHVLPFREARDGDDEKHICPLQLDVIERCMTLWTSPGDVVLSPFMGVGSEVYVAVRNGRKAVGVELKENYYRQSLRNLSSIQRGQIGLLDGV